MTTDTTNDRDASPALRVLVGYDGSPSAGDAITVGAAMLPGAAASIAYMWLPPFASPALTQRLRRRARNLDELVDSIEQEGGAEAQRLVDVGVAHARSAGWAAEGIVRRTYGDAGRRGSDRNACAYPGPCACAHRDANGYAGAKHHAGTHPYAHAGGF